MTAKVEMISKNVSCRQWQQPRNEIWREARRQLRETDVVDDTEAIYTLMESAHLHVCTDRSTEDLAVEKTLFFFFLRNALNVCCLTWQGFLSAMEAQKNSASNSPPLPRVKMLSSEEDKQLFKDGKIRRHMQRKMKESMRQRHQNVIMHHRETE